MRYRYVATSKGGKVESGVLEASDASEAGDQIRRAGLMVVSLRKERRSLLMKALGLGWVSPVEKVTFAKHLALMIKAGLPLDESVTVLREQAAGAFRRVLDDIGRVVETGRPLSEAFAEHPRVFSEFFISTIRAGEAGGTLEKSLDDLADQMVKGYELRRKVRSAMTYPVIVLAAAFILAFTLSLYVLPRIIRLFESITIVLPLSTRILLSGSRFLVENGLVAFPLAVIAVIAAWRVLRLRALRPYSHRVLLKLPVAGKFSRRFNLAVMARSLGTLLRAGVNIGEAIVITSDTVRNARFAVSLRAAKDEVEKGIPLSAALQDRPDLYPPIVTRMIAVGEKTGRLEETLFYLAEFYEDEVDAMAKNLSTLLEPVLLIVIGLMVAGIAISIIAPIYNFIGSIERL